MSTQPPEEGSLVVATAARMAAACTLWVTVRTGIATVRPVVFHDGVAEVDNTEAGLASTLHLRDSSHLGNLQNKGLRRRRANRGPDAANTNDSHANT